MSQHDRSILLFTHRIIEIEPPIILELGLSKSRDPRAPTISGLASEHIVLLVNGKECHGVFAVVGLLREVIMALQKYLVTLASKQAESLAKTPLELQSSCMLAGIIFAQTRHLDYGFPILEWDYHGYRRALVNFQESIRV